MKNIRILADELVAEAAAKGICEEWKQMIQRAESRDSLVQMYVKGIDFCVNNRFPSLDYMEENFKGVCEKYGVYINDRISLRNVRKAVIAGNTTGTAGYDSYEVAAVYLKDSSRIAVDADDHAIVTLDCFDASKVALTARNGAKVLVNLYGNSEAEYSCDGLSEVIVKRKHKDTYEL